MSSESIAAFYENFLRKSRISTNGTDKTKMFEKITLFSYHCKRVYLPFSIKINRKVISSFEHTEHKMLFNVVKLFCFGDCTDYLQSKDEVGYELNPAEINKLQLLSLISLASQVRYSKVIPIIRLSSD